MPIALDLLFCFAHCAILAKRSRHVSGRRDDTFVGLHCQFRSPSSKLIKAAT
jgi:hypothetical protein